MLTSIFKPLNYDAHFLTNRHLMETQNLVISFDYSWFLAKNLAYAECGIMKFHYRNSSNGRPLSWIQFLLTGNGKQMLTWSFSKKATKAFKPITSFLIMQIEEARLGCVTNESLKIISQTKVLLWNPTTLDILRNMSSVLYSFFVRKLIY